MSEQSDAGDNPAGLLARPDIQPFDNPTFHDLPADEQLDRLLGDSDLLLHLQLSGYNEADWAPAAAEFARYGFNVITGWLQRGAIFTKVFQITHRGLNHPDNPFDDDAVSTLATDTIIAALDAFKNVLRQNRWDPTKGASLKTYFVGQCCMQFHNVYRSWYRTERRAGRLQIAADLTVLESASAPAPDATKQLLLDADAAIALGLLSNDTARRAFLLFSLGYSYKEIVGELGLADEKAVDNLLAYQKRRVDRQLRKGKVAS